MDKGEVVLVIGAGDATGGAIARRFAREGYRAVVTRRARHLDRLEGWRGGFATKGESRTPSASMRARKTRWRRSSSG